MLQLVGPKKANDGRQAKETFAKFTREHEGEKFGAASTYLGNRL